MAACSSTMLWAADSYWPYVQDDIFIFLYEVKWKKNKTHFNVQNPFFFSTKWLVWTKIPSPCIFQLNKIGLLMFFDVFSTVHHSIELFNLTREKVELMYYRCKSFWNTTLTATREWLIYLKSTPSSPQQGDSPLVLNFIKAITSLPYNISPLFLRELRGNAHSWIPY